MRGSMGFGAVVIALAALGAGCASEDVGLASGRKVVTPPTSSCWVTGGGQIFTATGAPYLGGSFGGVAASFRNRPVDGEWNHVVHDTEDHFLGDPATIACFTVEGPPAHPPSAPANAITFSGSGTWNHEEGYTFTVYIEDHGEPNTSDYYEITVYDGQGSIVYTAGADVEHGNLQIHAPNAGHP